MSTDVGEDRPLLRVADAYPQTREYEQRRERWRRRVGPLLWLWCCVCLCCIVIVFFALGLIARSHAIGACCSSTDALCSEGYESQCPDGTFQGRGTRCSDVVCPTAPPTDAPSPQPTFAPTPPTPAPTAEPRGSCCLLAEGPACIEQTSEAECTALGTPRLFNVGMTCAEACPGSVNDTGVCCSFVVDDIVSCTSSFTEERCRQAEGRISIDAICAEVGPQEFDCVDVPTPAPTPKPTVAPTARPTFPPVVRGSCCATPGPTSPPGVPVTCLDSVFDTDCTFLGQTVFGSTVFSSSTNCGDAQFCPGSPSTGNCCRLTTACTESLNATICQEEFSGVLVVPGECIRETGRCRFLPTPSPTPAPTPVEPTPKPTPSPTLAPTPPPTPAPGLGACCQNLNTGPCTPLLTQALCRGNGGTYLGDNSSCLTPGVCGNPPAPTPSPTAFPIGACCNEANEPPTCSDGIGSQSCEPTGPLFVFGGDGSTCENNPGFCGNPSRVCCCVCDPMGSAYSQCVLETFRGCAQDCQLANAECTGTPRSLSDPACVPGVCDTPAPTPKPTIAPPTLPPTPKPTIAPPTLPPTPAPTPLPPPGSCCCACLQGSSFQPCIDNVQQAQCAAYCQATASQLPGCTPSVFTLTPGGTCAQNCPGTRPLGSCCIQCTYDPAFGAPALEATCVQRIDRFDCLSYVAPLQAAADAAGGSLVDIYNCQLTAHAPGDTCRSDGRMGGLCPEMQYDLSNDGACTVGSRCYTGSFGLFTLPPEGQTCVNLGGSWSSGGICCSDGTVRGSRTDCSNAGFPAGTNNTAVLVEEYDVQTLMNTISVNVFAEIYDEPVSLGAAAPAFDGSEVERDALIQACIVDHDCGDARSDVCLGRTGIFAMDNYYRRGCTELGCCSYSDLE